MHQKAPVLEGREAGGKLLVGTTERGTRQYRHAGLLEEFLAKLPAGLDTALFQIFGLGREIEE